MFPPRPPEIHLINNTSKHIILPYNGSHGNYLRCLNDSNNILQLEEKSHVFWWIKGMDLSILVSTDLKINVNVFSYEWELPTHSNRSIMAFPPSITENTFCWEISIVSRTLHNLMLTLVTENQTTMHLRIAQYF